MGLMGNICYPFSRVNGFAGQAGGREESKASGCGTWRKAITDKNSPGDYAGL